MPVIISNSKIAINSGHFDRNGTNETLPVWITYNEDMKIWFTVSLLMCYSGAVINALLLIVIIKAPALHGGSGLVIGSCAALELFFCAVSHPLTTVNTFFVQYGWIPSSKMCAIFQTILVLNYSLCDWTTLFLAVNRIVAIFFPHSYGLISSKRVCFMVMGAFTFGSLILVLPFAFHVETGFATLPPWQTCSFSPPKKGEYDLRMLNAVFTVHLPLSTAAVMYVLLLVKSLTIWRARQAKDNFIPQSPDWTARRTQYRRMAMARILCGAGALFCTFVFTNNLLNKFGMALISRYPMIQLWTRTFSVLGYMVQAMFLLTFNETYRKGLMTFCRGYYFIGLLFRRNRILDKPGDSKTTGRSA